MSPAEPKPSIVPMALFGALVCRASIVRYPHWVHAMRCTLLFVVICSLLGCSTCTQQQQKRSISRSSPCPGVENAHVSPLWGCDGERMDMAGRLHDWTYAGYAAGERPIPDLPVVADVKRDFGAQGDNQTDDSQAFLNAIRSVTNGTLYIPPGVYRLSEALRINTSSTVIRGAGSDKTILYFTRSLTQMYGNSWNSWGTSNSDYCWSGGVISAGWGGWNFMAPRPGPTVVVPARRGDRTLQLSGPMNSKIQAGTWVAVSIRNISHPGLRSYLQGGQPENLKMKMLRLSPMVFPTRVISVNGSRIELERYLPLDIDPGWNVSVQPFRPRQQEVGVEGLAITFKYERYNGHHQENGWNGIFFDRIANSWIRDVVVSGADNAILIKASFFITVTDVKVLSAPRNHSASKAEAMIHGHLGLGAKYGADNLFQNFEINTTLHHDVVVDSENLSVFSNGKGLDLRIDHHRMCPYGTLWTGLDVGRGRRMFESGGPVHAGPHTCITTTFWGASSSGAVRIPHLAQVANYGANVTVVGVHMEPTSDHLHLMRQACNQYGWHIERSRPGQAVHPFNLYHAMKTRPWTRQQGVANTSQGQVTAQEAPMLPADATPAGAAGAVAAGAAGAGPADAAAALPAGVKPAGVLVPGTAVPHADATPADVMQHVPQQQAVVAQADPVSATGDDVTGDDVTVQQAAVPQQQADAIAQQQTQSSQADAAAGAMAQQAVTSDANPISNVATWK